MDERFRSSLKFHNVTTAEKLGFASTGVRTVTMGDSPCQVKQSLWQLQQAGLGDALNRRLGPEGVSSGTHQLHLPIVMAGHPNLQKLQRATPGAQTYQKAWPVTGPRRGTDGRWTWGHERWGEATGHRGYHQRELVTGESTETPVEEQTESPSQRGYETATLRETSASSAGRAGEAGEGEHERQRQKKP